MFSYHDVAVEYRPHREKHFCRFVTTTNHLYDFKFTAVILYYITIWILGACNRSPGFQFDF